MPTTRLVLLVLVLVLSACAPPPVPTVKLPEAVPVEPEPVVPPAVPEQPARIKVPWSDVAGWTDDEPTLVLGAFLKSCQALRFKPEWQAVCGRAQALEGQPRAAVRAYFEESFEPYRLQKPDGDPNGLLTGYYVPDLVGRSQPSRDYPYPLYQRPEDLLVIDLSEVYPELGQYRLRGRLEGHRVIPYWDRLAIDGPGQPLAGQELFWVADPVELFFLHIQGSGRILLEDGRRVMVNYADQNGQPYRSIGKWMLDRGIMTRDQMSMQNIRAWARKNPDRVKELLGQNPSYVFFRELGPEFQSPPGALGVPLTPGRSLAVDRRFVPLGAPVFVATTWPNSEEPLQRLMVAQDTGGAIKGEVRGDFFWGMGDQAGELAGRMKQSVRMWLLLPKEGL